MRGVGEDGLRGARADLGEDRGGPGAGGRADAGAPLEDAPGGAGGADGQLPLGRGRGGGGVSSRGLEQWSALTTPPDRSGGP